MRGVLERGKRLLAGLALASAALLLAQAVQAAPIVNVATAPQSRSVPSGTTATFFVLMANSGDAAATNCGVFPPDGFDSSTFSFYALDANNAISGAANQPVDIPANASQMFLLTITKTVNGAVSGPFQQRIHPLYHCDNYQPLVYDNVNDILLTVAHAGASTPTDGLIALQTLSQDGIASIGSPGGVTAVAGAFVDISGNTSSRTITLTPSVALPGGPLPSQVKSPNGPPADTSATLVSAISPIKTTICLTDSTTGQCLSAPAPSVQINLPNGTASQSKAARGASSARPDAGGALVFTFTVFVQADGALGMPFYADFFRLLVMAHESSNPDSISGFSSTALRAPGAVPDDRTGFNDIVGVYAGVIRDFFNDPFSNGLLPFWMQILPDGKVVGAINDGVGHDGWNIMRGDGTPRPFTMDMTGFDPATDTFSGHIQSVSDPANPDATPLGLSISAAFTPNQGGRMTGGADTPSQTVSAGTTNLTGSPNLQMTAAPASGKCPLLDVLDQDKFDVWVDGVAATGTVTVKVQSGSGLEKNRVFVISPDDAVNGLVLHNPGALSGKHVNIGGVINEGKDLRPLNSPGIVKAISVVEASAYKAKIFIGEVPSLDNIISMTGVPPWQIVDCTANSFTVLVYDSIGGKGMILKFVRHTP